MIGISLPSAILNGSGSFESAHRALLSAYNNDPAQMLGSLRARGVESVEFGVRDRDADPAAAARAARCCADTGLQVTIHGELRGDESPECFFHPYEALQGQASYIITLHGLADMNTTAAALKTLAAYADAHMPRFYFALENNRRRPGGGACQSCAQVAQALKAVDHPRVNACWDFGHFYSNVRNSFESPSPPEDFLARAVHTHIHGLTDGKTHFPLNGDNLPLERYCALLAARGYRGIYNLELDFRRFYPQIEPRTALEESISLLKEVCV